ncbi:hypothetical protein N7478_000855 [Penicillium angulare]|uniref:uncharacterized protein n=1 Tax=Penicillium angulare TaxID=116970 RepID=UPI002541C248|nr:uncharacterized protein N7478_000855 [Penicillium angulare]KAJ5291604.1 hypothetical protein N7478_000855 [Penicillium angulare]
MDVRRYNVERSCLRCHERKVRCDKGNPCNKCLSLNVPCQYPGTKRAKRRAPKSSATDMVTRLEQLERSIATLAEQPSQSSLPASPASQLSNTQLSLAESSQALHRPAYQPLQNPQSSSGAEQASSSEARTGEALPGPLTTSAPSHGGFLVKNGSYVDEPFLSRVLEKEQELQSAMGSPGTNDNRAQNPQPMKIDGIITNPSLLQLDFQGLLPSRWQATVLWERFLSRVDPVVKCIHVPTTKSRIFAAISRPDSAPPDVHCLLFAIFFGAATTMCSDDPGNEIYRADLRRYQQGIELAMYKSSFLESPTVRSLQAMGIYLTCLRSTNSSRSGFTLRGLAIRAAQSIGLHRDGKHFKLSPFESELRRRVWWLLETTDARMAEDHGITVAYQGYGADTELPANIDDHSFSEDTETIISQPRWTDLSFPLIICEFNKIWPPICRASSNPNDGVRPEEILAKLKNTLHERYLQYSDPDIPIHRMGVMLSELFISKMEVHIRQKSLQLQGPSSMPKESTEATQELLRVSCNALNCGIRLYQDELLHGFRWLSSTYTQFHLLTYILWHLCVYPTDPYVDEAWRSVNMHFDLVQRDPSWPDPGPKWPMLAQLRAKALKIRNVNTATLQQQGASISDTSAGPEAGSLYVDDATMQGLDFSLADIDGLDLNWAEFFPDWNYMAQSITFMCQDGSGIA